jgi:hypothetical protein
VLAISDALSPGAACVRAITSEAGGGTLGWTFDVGGASSAVLSPETSEHAVALGSGHIVITSSGQVISKGSAVINRIGQLLASVADQVTRLEADGWGDAVAVLAVLKSDEVRLFTARGSQPMGSGTDATFVRSVSGAADELRIRGIAGTVESRAIARSAGGA